MTRSYMVAGVRTVRFNKKKKLMKYNFNYFLYHIHHYFKIVYKCI